MSYRFDVDQTVGENVRRMSRERLDDAVDALTAALDGEEPHENVHTARKRNKHVRALTRLVRKDAPEVHDRENEAIRDAARLVAPLRDATAVLETVDLLLDVGGRAGNQALRDVRSRLEAEREALADDAEDAIRQALNGFQAVRDRVDDWEIGEGFEAVAGGLAKTYGRARDRFEEVRAEATTARLHEWRKRVKYHRYHVRVLRDAWHPVLQARREELHDLSDFLGDDHDLAVLRGRLEGWDDDAARVVVALADRRRAELQHAALPLGRRLFADEPEALVARIGAAWHAWHDERAIDPTAPALTLAAAEG